LLGPRVPVAGRDRLVRLVAAAIVLALAGLAGAENIDRFRPWPGPTPPLELQDLAGNRHVLTEYRGSVVLINFWATWCPPCRDEMPSIQRLREILAGQPFVVLGVNYSESVSRITSFLKQVPVDFPMLRDPRHEAIEAWRVRTLPASFVVGPDGLVRYWVVGELDWATDDAVARVRGLLPKR
jgi:thiol-disulfide isomerase/thioredoxin